MIAVPEQEAEILTQAYALRNDPVGFVFWAYPWNQPGTPLDGINGPRDWQLEELEAIGKHVQAQEFALANGLPAQIYRSAWSSGRGPGKSAVFGMLSHWHTSTHWGAPTIVAANTETQLRDTTFPEFSRWFAMATNAHWFSVEGMKISVLPWLADIARKPPDQGGRNIDSKYWQVIGRTWKAESTDSFVGSHSPYGLMVLFDEAAGIHHGVWDKAEGFFTEINPYRFFMAASQMRHKEGRFHELFHEPEKMGKDWHTRTLSTRGMPGIDQAKIEAEIVRYGGVDSDHIRVEILGLAPLTSEDQFVPYDSVRLAQNNDLNRDYGEPLILGVDPAPRGKTSWRFRQGRNARDCCGSSTKGSWLGYDNVQIAQAILDLDAKYKPDAICIDFGMGTGVIDILKRKKTHGRQHEVRFGDQANDKSSEWATHAIELWALLRNWLSGGMIEKDSGEKGSLSQQLTDRGWRWSGREDGKKILETKDELQRRGVKSPDDADALACTFEVNPPRSDSRKLRGGDVQIADGTDTSITD